MFGAALLFLLPVGPAPAAATPATLEFETQELDLETGAILQLDDPAALPGESSDGDIHFAYNADRTPHCVVMQNQSAGAALAFLNATAFETVTYDDVAGLTFTSEIIDQPFGSDDTVVVRTAAGNHYKVGHASESDAAVTFDYELLAAPVAALQPAAEASLQLLASAPPAPELPAGLSSKDWRQIRSHLEQASYHVVRGASSLDQVAAATFEANNRRHKMRTVFDRESVRVIPTDGTAWEWGLKLRAYGYEGSTRAPQGAELVTADNRLEYRRGDLVEWYINDGRGLEQGFTLSEQPGERGDRDLLIELEFAGSLSPSWKQGTGAIAFNDTDGKTVLRYGGLLAWDAGGRDLPVELTAHKGGFALRVDDRQAVYPITIDPMVTNETLQLLPSGRVRGFGFSVALSGDTAVVGAYFADNECPNSGSAYVFQRDQGGAGNWGEVTKLLASDGAAFDQFGISVAVSGDDAVVGADLEDDKGASSGSAYVFQRDERGANLWGQVTKLLASDGAADDRFGFSVAVSGDTAVVGDWRDNGFFGAAYVFRRDEGGANLWGQVTKLAPRLVGSRLFDRFGWSVAVSGTVAVVGSEVRRAYVFAFDCTDNDGDGFGSPGSASCRNGAAEDCNDSDSTIFPGASEVCDSLDNDCNAAVDDGIVQVASTCGVGECTGNVGLLSCVAGVLVDSCDPLAGATAEVCDSLDNDCNAAVDDGIIQVATTCGVGECTGNVGLLSCVTGSLVDSCDPLAGATAEVCDSVDNDCNDVVDDEFVQIFANKHTVGAGTHPGSTKDPLAGIVVCAYDKSEGSCSRDTCGGISHQHYQCIVDSCGTDDGEQIFCCTTDDNGECAINAPPGDYIAISDDATKTTLPDPLGVSASDLVCQEVMQKHLQQIVKADGKKVPGKTSRRTGSELLVIEPEFIEWTGSQELYPFVFETVGDWEVTTAVTPPEGFVSDYDALAELVVNEVEAVQFTITDIGSDWVPTEAKHTVSHNGRRQVILSRVGVKLASDLAQQKGLDSSGHVLGQNGKPVSQAGFDPRAPRDCEIVGWVEPSPTDPNWTFNLRVGVATDLTLQITSGQGLVVETLAAGTLDPGEHEFTWDGDSLGSGRYFVTLVCGDMVQSVPLVEE